jgi:hypothetical protein
VELTCVFLLDPLVKLLQALDEQWQLLGPQAHILIAAGPLPQHDVTPLISIDADVRLCSKMTVTSPASGRRIRHQRPNVPANDLADVGDVGSMESLPAYGRAEPLRLPAAALARLKCRAAVVAGAGLCTGGGWYQAAKLICFSSPVILKGRGVSTFWIRRSFQIRKRPKKPFGL